MIEIAPNPSGPAHIGTLRTYAKAWRLADERGEQLFCRFDAHNIVPASHRNLLWATRFLEELKELDMLPDGWEYLSRPERVNVLPEWADVRSVLWGHDQNGVPMADGPMTDIAYYPEPVPEITLPSDEPTAYRAGEPDPMVKYDASCPCWYYFGVRSGEGWLIDESLVALQRMHFRGVTTIVRSSLSIFLRHYLELPARKFFGYNMPETIKVDVVCDNAGALSKHRLGAGDPGTIRYSLDAIGADKLRDVIMLSLDSNDEGIARHWREIVGHG